MTNRIRHPQKNAQGTMFGTHYSTLARFGHHPEETKRTLSAALGPCVYALRTKDGVIKIGFTRNLDERRRRYGPWTNVLAAVPGTLQDEQQIHRGLVSHRARGREYYHPNDAVLAVINELRDQANWPPLTTLTS